MSLEQTIQDLDKTLQELTGSVIEIVKYLNTVKPTEEVKPDAKPKEKAKTTEQPIVVDVPVGSLDGETAAEEEEIVEAIEAEVVKTDIQPVIAEVSLEELQKLAKDLVAKDNGNSDRAKGVITKYAEKISMFTPEQRIKAAKELAGFING